MSVEMFLKSAPVRKARWRLVGLLLLMFGISGRNAAIRFAGRYFTPAIGGRDWPGFYRYAPLAAGVFAGFTPVRGLCRFTGERPGLIRREA
jgi:hypothetical protein